MTSFLKRKNLVVDDNFFTLVGHSLPESSINDYATRFGSAVSISEQGNRIAVASSTKENSNYVGLVSVYEYDSSTYEWVQIGTTVRLDGGTSLSDLDLNLQMSGDGNSFIVGTVTNQITEDNTSDGFSCKARVYRLQNGQYLPLGEDFVGEESLGDSDDVSVSINYDGARVAIGFSLNDSNMTDNGVARVYDMIGVQWVQVGNDINGEHSFELSGFKVVLSSDGTTVAVSSPYHRTVIGNEAGSVRIFRLQSDTWILLGDAIVGANDGDLMGSNLAINKNGNRIAISSEKFDHQGGDKGTVDTGHVLIFDYDPCTNRWSQLGRDIIGEQGETYNQYYGYHIGDNSGKGLALSSDGLTIAIGSPYNRGGGHYYAGSVRLYNFRSSINEWFEIGSAAVGETDQDMAGWSIAMSGKGDIFAIGSPGYSMVANSVPNGKVTIVQQKDDPSLYSNAPTLSPLDGGCSPFSNIVGQQINQSNRKRTRAVLVSSLLGVSMVGLAIICYFKRNKIASIVRRRRRK